MELQDLKRWQWALVGLLGGLVLGFAYRFVYTELDPGLPTLKQPEELAPLLVARDFETGRPIADDLVIYPPESPESRAQLVTVALRQVYRFEDAEAGTHWTQSRWEPRQIWAEIPFDEVGPAGNTFADYIAGLQDRGLLDGASVSFAWWQQPLPGLLLFASAGVLLVGGVWPTVLNVLVGAGLGVKKNNRDYDLSRFGSEAEEGGGPPARRGMSEAEQDQLADVTASLEASTTDLQSAGPVVGTAGEAFTEGTATRRLLTEDRDPAFAAPADAEQERDFEGEYYPVARSRRHEE